MKGLLDVLVESEVFKSIRRSITAGVPTQTVQGLSGSPKTYFISSLYSTLARSIAIVTYSLQQAEKLLTDFNTFLGPGRAFIFPPLEVFPHEEVRESPDILYDRLKVETMLAQGRQMIVILPSRSLIRKLIPGRAWAHGLFALTPGTVMDLEALTRRLVTMGFERVEMVEHRGQFSVRGGIVDIFPTGSDAPFRVEFFGDEVDSIREFDPATQRTTCHLESASLAPAREFVLDMSEDIKSECLNRIRTELGETCRRLTNLGARDRAKEIEGRVNSHLEKLERGIYFDSDEQYAPFFYRDMESILDRMPGALVILDEPARIRESLSAAFKEIHEGYISLLERGAILPSQANIYAGPEDITGMLRKRETLGLTFIPKGTDFYGEARVWNFQARTAESFNGNMELLVKALQSWRRKSYSVVAFVSTTNRARGLVESLRQNDVPALYCERPGSEVKPGNVVVTVGELENGFEFPSQRLIVLTDLEIYGAPKKKRRVIPTEDAGKISSYTDLVPGDYVVHVNHGIGKYLGVQTLEVAGVKRDYLVVKYAGEDKLYVPTDQVHLLQKYIGLEESVPKIYKLGGSEWSKVKNRVRETVRDIAKKLIDLYAVREATKGHAFSPDTVWQKEFEEMFPYEETPDQWRAIEEVKRDMEKPRPMDRLLCGDVGYGKTEVAIRAAFKAVMDNKQAAMLVPTTILAQQHYGTFCDRFQGFPVKIAVLSRFQSDKEQQEVLKGLRRGDIDIVIGTHRLLQRDVKFKDLGLLIVDEEQRFGVMHKEALKELKKNVDVLTLTATPIPRTLHMSLVGIRDMSLIQTPPENRFPVRTYVMEYDENVIHDAILRELDRGGQVYFVHNRIQSIESCASRLAELVPGIRIGIAHGQMPEERLEKTMLQFLDRDYDVLVCTTIIENGLDIPNVNTIIVDDADTLGLAQLYQLRGRVGRANRVAYAYFMYRKDRILAEAAEKRLEAIKEFTDLGSGFKIAMRDLEIRGAGNILGPEQHGHIAAVGFELYAELMRDSIRELKGEEISQEIPDPIIELPVSAFIPDDYVPDSRQKVELYKKVNAISCGEDASDLEDEIRDRFGELPPPVHNLLLIARIKAAAKNAGVTSIASQRDGVTIKLSPFVSVSGEDLMAVVRAHRGKVRAEFGRSPALKIRSSDLNDSDLLALVEACILGIGTRRKAVSGE
ncbi:MAG TPA: transcription-repair coupling factor [Firmicutes bacterium]|nr:transcription-repair coupling factor [Bacillota bacterium]